MTIKEFNEKCGNKAIIVDELPDYENAPCFVRMAEETKAFLEENGLPEEYVEKYGIPEGWNMKKK